MKYSVIQENKYQSYILVIVLSIIWGSSFILIKKGILGYSPWQAAALRIVISGIVLLPFFLRFMKGIKKNKIGYIFLFGLCEVGIPPFLYTIAQTKIDSSIAGILNSLVPLFTLITGIIFFKIKYKLYKVFGVLLGLSGAMILIFSRTIGPVSNVNNNNAVIYGLLIVIATILYGFGGNILKNYLQQINGFIIVSFSMVIMAIPASFFLIFSDFFKRPINNPIIFRSFLSIFILSIFCSAIAIYLYSLLVQKSTALKASFVTYLIPVIALLWGVMDGEKINFRILLALILIIVSVFLINRPKGKSLFKKPG